MRIDLSRARATCMAEFRSTRLTDDVFDALADARRRELLRALLEDGPQDDWRANVVGAGAEAAPDERLVEMHHVHLPKLEASGFVARDPRTHTVAKGRNFDDLRPLLELLGDHDDELLESWL